MLELPRHNVPRELLGARVADAPLIVLEAASGFGKSTFASQLVAEQRAAEIALGALDGSQHRFLLMLQRGLRKAGEHAAASALSLPSNDPEEMLDAMAEVLGASAPLWLVIDDAHHLTRDAGVLVALAQRRPPSLRLVVTARTLPASAHRLLTLPGVEHVESDDLRFSSEDAAYLLRERLGLNLDDAEIDRLITVTEGWPAGVALAGTRLRRSRRPDARTLGMDLPERFADVVLSTIPETLLPDIVQLSHLPSIDTEIADAVGEDGDLLDRLLAVGLPLARDENGAIRIPGALADTLRRRAPLRNDVARRVASLLTGRGRAFDALTALRIARLDDDAARLLVEIPAAARRTLSADEVIGAIDALPLDVLERHPIVLVELARAAARTGVPGAQTDALDRAGSARSIDPVLRRAIEAERMTLELYTRYLQDRAGQEAKAKRLVTTCGPGEERTLARALFVQGQQLAWSGQRSEADIVLRRAAGLFVGAGEDYEASRVLVQLGFNVHLHDQLSLAERTFAEAVERAGTDGRVRATALTYLGEVKVWRGRPEEGVADLEEAVALARAVRDERALAYALWGLALQSSVSDDVERTVSRVDQAARHLRPWMETSVGATFVATMTDLLDRVGAVEQADRMLAEARRRRSEAPELTVLAEFGIAARRGDPARAEQLWSEVEADDGIEPFERVRCRILRAWAALRREDPDTARRYRELIADGESLGDDGVPWHLEPDAAQELKQWWSRQSSGWRIRVLGELEVRRGAEAVALPPGRPSELVMLLAVHGRPLRVETVLDALWGDSSPETAGARLRQVLYRLRLVAPALVVRDETGLRLDAEVIVDLAEFTRWTTRFARNPQDRDSAQRAIDLVEDGFFARHFSPRVAPAFEAARERVRAQLVLLRDGLARHATDEEIVDHLRHAHELDPANVDRAQDLATRLLASGHANQAQAVVDATAEALSELDLPVTSRLLDIERRIREKVG